MRGLLLISFLFVSVQSFSQDQSAVDEKSFKLYLYNVATSDSTAHISKAQLLEASELYTNYNWITIKKVIVYLANSVAPSRRFEPGKKNSISKELRKYFESLPAGAGIVIAVEAYGPKNKLIAWPEINIELQE